MDNQELNFEKLNYYEGGIYGCYQILQKLPNKHFLVKCLNCGKERDCTATLLRKAYRDPDYKCPACLGNERLQYEVGMKAGCIEIIERLDSNNFIVRCNNCGKEFKMSGTTFKKYFLKDSVESCRFCKEKVHKSHKHWVGEILGNCYELIEFLGGSRWITRCTKCGRIQEQSISNMQKHKLETCYYCDDPTRKSRAQTGVRYETLEERYYNYYKKQVESANDRGKKFKEFKLSFDEFKSLIKGNCCYCGAEPSEDNIWAKSAKRISKGDEDNKFNGIDRIDSSKGYYKENCVSCCTKCNRMKLDYSVNDFLNHINNIFNYQKMRNGQLKNVNSSELKQQPS